MGLKTRESKTYATIISGTIRVKAEESDPTAVRRDYELRDGTKGTKFEKIYHELSGMIKKVEFFDGDFGRTLNITFSDDGEIILVMGIEQNYAEDVMKKLPNIDFSKEVTFKPYSFEDKQTKKRRRGVSINQGGEKITNFFSDGQQAINGFPEVEAGKQYDKDDWKMYFLQTRKFLQNYTTEHVIPKLEGMDYQPIDIGGGATIQGKEVEIDDEIKVENIPF